MRHYIHIRQLNSGIYLLEDLHTSYWPSFGGGFRNKQSFIEYSKDLIDHLNAWYLLKKEKLEFSNLTRSLYSISTNSYVDDHFDALVELLKKLIKKKI